MYFVCRERYLIKPAECVSLSDYPSARGRACSRLHGKGLCRVVRCFDGLQLAGSSLSLPVYTSLRDNLLQMAFPLTVTVKF